MCRHGIRREPKTSCDVIRGTRLELVGQTGAYLNFACKIRCASKTGRAHRCAPVEFLTPAPTSAAGTGETGQHAAAKPPLESYQMDRVSPRIARDVNVQQYTHLFVDTPCACMAICVSVRGHAVIIWAMCACTAVSAACTVSTSYSPGLRPTKQNFRAAKSACCPIYRSRLQPYHLVFQPQPRSIYSWKHALNRAPITWSWYGEGLWGSQGACFGFATWCTHY